MNHSTIPISRFGLYQWIKKNYVLLIVLTLLVTAFITYSIVSYSIPVDGDGGMHAQTVEVIAARGRLINFHPYILADGDRLLPIYYPKLFYVEAATLRIVVGSLVYWLMVPFLGVLSGLFVYLISRNIFKNKALAILPALITLCSYGLITNSTEMFRMETMVIMLNLSAIYSAMKYLAEKNKVWLILTTIFLGAALGTKQLTYVILPVFLLLIFLNNKHSLRSKFKISLIIYGVSFMIAAPVLINQFMGAGTLFYPGVPLVSKLEPITSKVFKANLYEVGQGWKKYAIGSSRVEDAGTTYSNPSSHFKFLDPLRQSRLNNPFVELTYLFLALGLLFFIKTKQFTIPLFLLSQQYLLYRFPLERYFLINQILASILFSGGVLFLYLYKGLRNPYIRLAPLIIALSVSFISAKNILAQTEEIPDYSYGMYAPGRLSATVEAGQWLSTNTGEDAVIITPRVNVVSYQSSRKSLWLNQIGGDSIYEAFLNNDIDSIYRIAKHYPESYILIPNFWVVKGEADGLWISFVEQKTVDMIGQDTKHFKEVHKNGLVLIYKIV